MDLHITHLSTSGYKKTKLLKGVTNMVMDWGHEIKGEVTPAIRIDCEIGYPYFLSKVYKPAKLVYETQKLLGTSALIALPVDIFDHTVEVKSIKYSLREYLRWLPYGKFARTEAFAMFDTEQHQQIQMGDISPILRKNKPKLAECWRVRLPTPKNFFVSKLNFFNEILNFSIIN